MMISAMKVIRLSATNFFPRDTCPPPDRGAAAGARRCECVGVGWSDASLRQPEQEQDAVTAGRPIGEASIAVSCRDPDDFEPIFVRYSPVLSVARQQQIANRSRRRVRGA